MLIVSILGTFVNNLMVFLNYYATILSFLLHLSQKISSYNFSMTSPISPSTPTDLYLMSFGTSACPLFMHT